MGIWAAVLYIPDDFLFIYLAKTPSFQTELKAWLCLGTRWGFSALNPGWRKMLLFGLERSTWLSISSSEESFGSLFSPFSPWSFVSGSGLPLLSHEPICRHLTHHMYCNRECHQGGYCEGKSKNLVAYSEPTVLASFSANQSAAFFKRHCQNMSSKVIYIANEMNANEYHTFSAYPRHGFQAYIRIKDIKKCLWNIFNRDTESEFDQFTSCT